MKYFLYARKSSESEDRQVQSIDDQKHVLQRLAKDRGLTIVKVLEESRSAKQPGRPVFNEMLQQIHAGKAQGILCWKLDRLSRNPIDGGSISWALQKSEIQHIFTPEREYYPADNVLMMAMELGMANQFIRDLSQNVKRGIKSKLEKGWLPGCAPIGYLNDRSTHTIVQDSERAPLVRKAFDLMLTGNYTAPKVLQKLNEWGLRSPPRKSKGGIPISESTLYKVLNNTFYAGIITHKGKEYQGAHEPLITLAEHDRIQEVLGGKGKPRQRKHEFAFTGTIRCGVCGYMITGENKKKHLKNGTTRHYQYYRCGKQRTCKQPSIPTTELEQQINEQINTLTILPEFKDWALEILQRENDKEIATRSSIQQSQDNTVADTQKKIDQLTQMRLRELIDDTEYLEQKETLRAEKIKLEQQRSQVSKRADNWLELIEKAFVFVTRARQAFADGDLERRREILRTMGVSFSLTDKTLGIELEPWLQVLQDEYPALEEEYLKFEPSKHCQNSTEEALAGVSLRWLGR